MKPSTDPREQRIADFLETSEGRKRLAQAMAQPVRGRGLFPKPCPVCGKLCRDVAAHASGMDDEEHQVLEVMES